MKIIDNYLKKKETDYIYNVMVSEHFAWFVTPVTNEDKKNFQFTHGFYRKSLPNSGMINLIKPFLEKLNPKKILRCKVNLLHKTHKIIQHDYHCDLTNSDGSIGNCKIGIFYLNTNNGYTIFKKNKKKIQSIKNRAVFFDNKDIHAGSTCTDSKFRIVLNINYE